MAARADIVIDQGTTFTTSLNLTDNTGAPLNLTGYTAEGQIRQWYTSSTYNQFNVTIPDPTNGQVILSLDSNTTSSMAYGRYVYDLITIDSGSNTITRIVEGTVTVTPAVTQYVPTVNPGY